MSKRTRRKAKQAADTAQAAANAPRRPDFGEIGGTGLRTSYGKVLEEYNPDLKGPKLYDQYDRMLRSHGQVQAVELAVTLPVESIRWRIDPNSRRDPVDLRIADDLSTNLFDGMTCTWEDVIMETMMSPLMGVAMLEKVWEPGSGRLRKLAPRHPRTIVEWIFDEEGGTQGIKQRVTNPVTNAVTDKPIPIAKLLRFTYRGHGGNPEGRGLMRPMRTHWHIVQALWNIANTGFEGLYNPAAMGKLPPNYNASDKDAYAAVLRHFGRGVLLPPGYADPTFPAGNQRLPSITDYIAYHDTLIARSALAQFLQLGSGETGSWALSDSHVTLFLMTLEQIAKRIASVFNRYLIPEWVGYHYPGVDQFPSLAWSPIAHIVQKAGILHVLTELANGKLLTRGDDIEELIRDMLGLGEKPEREADEEEDDDSDAPETIPQEDVGASRRYRALEGGPTGPPPLSAAARKRQRPRDDEDFDRNDRRLTAAKDKFQRDMKAVIQRQHELLKKMLKPLIEDFKAASDLSKGTVLKKMQKLEVPLVGKYENLISSWLRDFYQTAIERAAKEAKLDPPKSIPNAVRTWLATRAQVIAQKHSEALRAAVLFEALDVVRREIPTKQILWNIQQQATQRANLDIREDLVAAGRELTDLVNEALAEVALEPAE